jgi:hypothetical protein
MRKKNLKQILQKDVEKRSKKCRDVLKSKKMQKIVNISVNLLLELGIAAFAAAQPVCMLR